MGSWEVRVLSLHAVSIIGAGEDILGRLLPVPSLLLTLLAGGQSWCESAQLFFFVKSGGIYWTFLLAKLCRSWREGRCKRNKKSGQCLKQHTVGLGDRASRTECAVCCQQVWMWFRLKVALGREPSTEPSAWWDLSGSCFAWCLEDVRLERRREGCTRWNELPC